MGQFISAPNIVREIENRYPVADRVEQQHRHSCDQKNPPRSVAGQAFQIAADRSLRQLRVVDPNPFARPAEAEPEKQGANRSDNGHGASPRLRHPRYGHVAPRDAPAQPVGISAAEPSGKEIHQRLQQHEGHQTAHISEEHPVGGKRIAYLRIGRHHPEQRGIGDVDHRIDHHHGRIGDIGPRQFPRHPEIGSPERQHSDRGEGKGTPQQVRTITPPSAAGTIRQQAHDGIVERIPDTGHQEHGPGGSRRDAEHLGVEKEQIHAEYLPEHARSHVPETVSDLLPECDAVFHRLFFLS